MSFKNIAALALAGMLSAGMAGCGAAPDKEPTKITVTDNGWDSQKIHNTIAELVVENAYDGYTIEMSTASSNMNWQALISGEVDLDIESWTDNVVSYADDIASGAIVDIGVLVPDSRQGLYVPRYVVEGDAARGIEPMAPELKTVKDLKKYPDVLPDDEDPSKGRIYGGTPGFMADEVLHKKYEAYGLNDAFTYTRLGSEAAIFASLAAAYNLGDPWVGYCYEPTWVTGKLDLILLEDEPYDAATFFEGTSAFPSQELKIVSSKGFVAKAPELVSFFENYQTGSAMIASALAYLDENKSSYEETAIWLMRENDALLDKWLPAENAAKMRDYLSAQS